jgi:hypothetical protein
MSPAASYIDYICAMCNGIDSAIHTWRCAVTVGSRGSSTQPRIQPRTEGEREARRTTDAHGHSAPSAKAKKTLTLTLRLMAKRLSKE